MGAMSATDGKEYVSAENSSPQGYTKVYTVFIALFIVGASFFLGAWFGYEKRPAVEKVLRVTNQKQPPQFENTDFSLFWEVWSQLEDKYVERAKIDRKKLVFGAIQGLVKGLSDPYTEFMPPVETKQFQEDIKGSFGGIGAEIGIRKSILIVVSPLKDSPSEKAGLKAGDQILQIDDTVTNDLGLDEAVNLIRGPKGTTVRLIIFRQGLDKTKEFKVVRDIIKVPVLATEKNPGGVFVIKLYHFTENAGYEFRKAVEEFYASNSKKLVLDVRNNPGGYLTVSVEITSWFLPYGEVVVREVNADKKENVYRSNGYKLLENIPTVMLVNQGSASASEIVAGALRDVRGIKLIGAKTFGKGSVQEVQSLPEGSSLKITIAKWLTPKGQEINGKGLEPDVKVELPKESNDDSTKDVMLEKAIEVLKSL